MTKISVIIPIYNVEKYLKNCIESLINQSYRDMELIFVDDGSTDSSFEIAKKFSLSDERIVLLHKKNGGLSDARNYGLKYATGEYVTFIDSDDVISENMIEILYNNLVENNADISIIDPVHFYDDDENISYQICNKTIIYDNINAICDMLYQKSFLVSAWGKLYKKRLFDNIKFPVGMYYEDIAVMYKLLYSSKKIVYNNSKLYGYRHRLNSITTEQFSIKNLDIITISKEMRDYFSIVSNSKINKAVDTYLLNAYFRIYMNVPNNEKYIDIKKEAESYIKKNGYRFIFSSKVRKKLKIAIILFFINKKLLFKVYNKVDRWK